MHLHNCWYHILFKIQNTQNDIITSRYSPTNQKLSNDTYINLSNTNPATTQSTSVTTSVIFKTSSSIKTTIKPKRYIILVIFQTSGLRQLFCQVMIILDSNLIIFQNRKYAVLTYDAPETYKGPIVQGWPPSKDRSIPLYMKG